MVTMDFISNNQGFGFLDNAVAGAQFDPGFLRPFYNSRGERCVTVNGRPNPDGSPRRVTWRINDLQRRGIQSLAFNATALRKEEWIKLDEVVLRAARYRLKAWADLARTASYGGFNGMSKMLLEHETVSDPGEAIVDMDGLTAGRTDAPTFQLEGLPLPITHVDFYCSNRRLMMSRNTGMPFDSQMGEAGGRRIAECIEKTTIGIQTGVTYGNPAITYGRTAAVYGYLNFPTRIQRTGLTKPTHSGWTPATTLADVLGCLDALRLQKFFGPFMIYTSNDWDQYMDNDYILTGGNVATQTLRERLKRIDGVTDVQRLDFLFASQPASSTGPGGENLSATYPFTLIFAQQTSDVARAVNGLDITTVQWEKSGGMQLCFKTMCIQVPQLRADRYGNCGIMQATATIA